MTGDELAVLLSVVSHELRGPIGVTRGYLRILEGRDSVLSQQQRHAVQAALRGVDRSTDLLDQMSTLARLHREDRGRQLERTPLAPLLHAATEAVNPQSRDGFVQIDAVPTLAVNAEPPLLRTALTGLLASVLRAQSPPARLALRAAEAADNGRPGVEIAIGSADRPISDFEQGSLDLSRGGHGLDLITAAVTVRVHDGEVRELRERTRLAGVIVWLPRA